jgi:hypothetical protein
VGLSISQMSSEQASHAFEHVRFKRYLTSAGYSPDGETNERVGSSVPGFYFRARFMTLYRTIPLRFLLWSLSDPSICGLAWQRSQCTTVSIPTTRSLCQIAQRTMQMVETRFSVLHNRTCFLLIRCVDNMPRTSSDMDTTFVQDDSDHDCALSRTGKCARMFFKLDELPVVPTLDRSFCI